MSAKLRFVVAGDGRAHPLEGHHEIGLCPLQRDVRVGDVHVVAEIVEFGAAPVVGDLRERSIEVIRLALPINKSAGSQKPAPVIGRHNRIEQTPLRFVAHAGEKHVSRFDFVAEIARAIRHR